MPYLKLSQRWLKSSIGLFVGLLVLRSTPQIYEICSFFQNLQFTMFKALYFLIASIPCLILSAPFFAALTFHPKSLNSLIVLGSALSAIIMSLGLKFNSFNALSISFVVILCSYIQRSANSS